MFDGCTCVVFTDDDPPDVTKWRGVTSKGANYDFLGPGKYRPMNAAAPAVIDLFTDAEWLRIDNEKSVGDVRRWWQRLLTREEVDVGLSSYSTWLQYLESNNYLDTAGSPDRAAVLLTASQALAAG